MKKATIARFAGLAALIAGALHAASAQQYAPTLREFLRNDGRFETFLHLAKTTGADSWLGGNPSTGVTLVVPTDTAFAKVPSSVMAALSKNRDALLKVMEYHIVLRNRTAADIKLGPKTVEGEALSLTGGVPPRTANIISKDIETDNGMIQVVDQVLFPPSVFENLQRNGDIPIAVGLAIHPHMTAAGIIHDVPLRTTAARTTKRKKGHWGRVPGRYGRVWITTG